LDLLSCQDGLPLLNFELTNQAWFESTIPARDSHFYSERGITDHIEECLELYENDEMLPMLIRDGSQAIIGRINLHCLNVDSLSAHLGYRIAQSETGKGVATKATQKLLSLCDSRYHLETLVAFAATENLASQRVLINNQFIKTRTHSNYTKLNGKLIHCIEYHRKIG
jgi:ribosomal-protein-alanine N-acetyltransferase